jgi:pilus assembly protein CpaF
VPLVTSHAWLAEKLAGYQTNTLDQQTAGESSAGKNEFGKPLAVGLSELVSVICSRILDTEPALVADVAAGRASRQALLALIGRTAEKESLRAGFFQTELQQQVMDFLFGYGPLQPYVDHEDVTDIDGTGPDEFSIKICGRRMPLAVSFADTKAYDTFCRLVIIRNGGIINENDSHCRVTDEHCRLRINVTVPPRSVRAASISIRKHRRQGWRLPDLQEQGMLDARLVDLLTDLAKSDATVLFCGKGAAGKTTLLRAFIQAMPILERVLIAESDSEIYPEKPYCLVQRIKKAREGGRQVSLRDLIADGLTMSLDTYCIGEIVGEEAMEFMRAAFSGHRCLATTHANSAADALDRLLALARPAAHGESDRLLRKMLGHSVNTIVFLKNFRVTQVIRIHGCLGSEEGYDMEEIWPTCQNEASDVAVSQPAVKVVSGS